MQVGPIVIHTYPALMYLGLGVGSVLAALEVRRRQLEPLLVVDATLAAGVGSLLMGRAMYVGFHWAYYGSHLGEAIRIWEGGLAWQGALIGGVVGATVVTATQGASLPTMLDVMTPGAASLATCGWLACHAVGCAYGVETYPGQGLLWTLSRDLPDLYGIREPRVAMQLVGAGWSALLLGGVLLGQRNVRRSGVVFALWVTLQSLGMLGLGFVRADEMVLVAGWRVDQLINVLLSAAGLAMAAGRMTAARGSLTGGGACEM
ncbi:MAG: prolipoprotein diacylglyceryl transferase [Chloroflexota bacterium]